MAAGILRLRQQGWRVARPQRVGCPHHGLELHDRLDDGYVGAAKPSAAKACSSRTTKENRTQGELFELLVLRHIAAFAQLPFAYQADLDHLSGLIRARQRPAEGAARIARQQRHAAAAAGAVRELFEQRIAALGKITAVAWVGRSTSSHVADICVEHEHGRTRLSCKSTKHGTGTARNLGMSGLVRELGLTGIGGLSETMHRETLEELRRTCPTARFAQLAVLPRSKLKQHVSDEERKRAGAAARPSMVELTTRAHTALTGLTQGELRAFAAVALGCDGRTDDLFLVVANDADVGVHGCAPVPGTAQLSVSRAKDTRLTLYADGRRLVSLQAGCSNGKGLSSLCMRCFAER